jgi:hypothetical protein
MLKTDELRQVFGELLEETLVHAFAVEFGVIERERKLDLRAFPRAGDSRGNARWRPAGGCIVCLPEHARGRGLPRRFLRAIRRGPRKS